MSESLENKPNFKENLISFSNKNKLKIVLFFVFIFLLILSIIFYNNHTKKKNEIISERFIQAQILLSDKTKLDAHKIFEEIILSKNKFYSVLALNTILEKDLIQDKAKIIEYFELIEEINLSKDQKDLLILKKALFLIENLEKEEGYKILKKLSKSDSNFKILAKDILEK